MKIIRRLHLYLGCFFAPLLLFFVATGYYQILVPHRMKSISEAETWLQKVRVVHTDQIYPAEGKPDWSGSPRLFQMLVGLMSGCMILSTVLGVVLAFRMVRPVWLVWLVLAGGVLVPVVALWLGQKG